MRYGSLFSGAGGFELGLSKLGWGCMWMCERDKFARGVLSHNFPGVPLYQDIVDLNGADLAPVDVIVGGFPCQDLSNVGKMEGLRAERSGLFYDFVRIVDEMREATDGEFPRAVIWENVLGLLSRTKDWISDIYTAWGEIGAVVQEHRVVDAQYFGVAQRRRRVIGVTVFDTRAEGGREILLEPEGVCRDLEACREPGEIVAALTASGVGTCGPDDNQAQAGHLLIDKSISGIAVAENQHEEVRLSRMHPSITTGGGKPGQGYPAAFIENELVRRLTPLECERLMGWPDNWTANQTDDILTSDSQRYKMCGNGLVAPVAEWAGRRLERTLKDMNGEP